MGVNVNGSYLVVTLLVEVALNAEFLRPNCRPQKKRDLRPARQVLPCFFIDGANSFCSEKLRCSF